VESVLEVGRQGFNEAVGSVLGIEVKRNQFENTSEKKKQTPSRARATSPRVRDGSFFWNPNAPNSPFVNRAAYLAQFEELRGNPFDSNGACEIVPEEEIDKYVAALCEDGSLKGIYGLPSFLVPKTVYSSVVKICLRVVQTIFGEFNGQAVLGRELYFLKRQSFCAKWRVSTKHNVDEQIVAKLVRRVMSDHGLEDSDLSTEVQKQVYHNIITLLFRLVFDLIDSSQLRVLGHTVTINVEADENLAEAPGWDIPLDQGIFGRFDIDSKRAVAKDLVNDILEDESIQLPHCPNMLERHIYTTAVMLMFELSETACNHLRLHFAGISFRPALDNFMRRAESNRK